MKHKHWLIILCIVIGLICYVFFRQQQNGEIQHIDNLAIQLKKKGQELENRPKTIQTDAFEEDPYKETQQTTFNFPDEVVKYFFASAIAANVELFYTNFSSEAIFAAFPNPKTMNAELLQQLKRLTKDGQLKDIGIVSKKVIDPEKDSTTIEYVISMQYGAFGTKKVSITLKKFIDEHNDVTWFVITPITEMISQIQ